MSADTITAALAARYEFANADAFRDACVRCKEGLPEVGALLRLSFNKKNRALIGCWLEKKGFPPFRVKITARSEWEVRLDPLKMEEITKILS